ncbi:MAG: hypothetical protein IPO67_01600 [Deltaproteobacteria bacterium]|nr:hypothetical protein [Deltaproteobacteria bacterium]
MRLTPALVVFTLALSLACGRPGKEGDGGGLFGDDTGDDGTDLPTLADVPNAVAYLNNDTQGRHYTDLAHPGDVCPQGWTHLGGGYNTVACTSGKPGVVALLDETVDGDHYSTFDQEGEVCPEGWEYIGGGYDAVACHKAGNEGPPVYIDQDTDGNHYGDLPHAGEVCPQGWTHLGGGSYTQACQARRAGPRPTSTTTKPGCITTTWRTPARCAPRAGSTSAADITPRSAPKTAAGPSAR